MIYPVALTLFSGNDLEITVHNGVTYICLEGGWILLQVFDHKVINTIISYFYQSIKKSLF